MRAASLLALLAAAAICATPTWARTLAGERELNYVPTGKPTDGSQPLIGILAQVRRRRSCAGGGGGGGVKRRRPLALIETHSPPRACICRPATTARGAATWRPGL